MPIQNISVQIIRSAIWVVAIWAAAFSCSKSQSFQQKIFTVKDGLPANAVSAFCQDNRGFIWIGTNNGMASFDGYTFKVFHHNAKDSNSLSSDKINYLLQDRKNRIWISTYIGLNCFDPVTERFTHYSIPLSSVNHIINQQADKMIIDATGRLWIATYNGLYYFDEKKNKLTEFPLDPSVLVKNYFNWIVNMCADKRYLYINSNHGNCVIDYVHLKIYSQLNNPLHLEIFNAMKDARINFVDNKIYYWKEVPGKNEYDLMNYDFLYNRSKPVGRIKNINATLFFNIESINDHQFVVLDINGNPYFITGKTGEKSDVRLDGKTRFIFIIKTRRYDGAANFWCSTPGGLILMSPKTQMFKTINLNDSIKIKPPMQINRLMLYNNQTLWIGSSSTGVAELNLCFSGLSRQFKSFTSYKSYYNFIWNLYKDGEGKIWIGRQTGYSVYDIKEKRISDFFLPRNDFTSNKFYVGSSFCQTDDSTIYMGSNKGMAEINEKDGVVRKWWTYNSADSAAFPINRIFNMASDGNGNIWLSIDEGICLFNPTKETFQLLKQITKGKIKLPDIETTQLFVLGKQLFIASEEGLFIFNKEQNQLHSFTYSEGMPGNLISSVLPLNDTICWLTTSQGLSQLNLKYGTFTNYTYKDGLPSFENGTSNLIQLPDGKIIFGMDSELISFDPDIIRSSIPCPRTFITNFAADGKNNFVSDSGLASISVPWTTRVLNIHFSTLQYSDAGFAEYQYRIDQIDKSWNNSFTNNEVNYSDLPAGKYHFEVRAGYGNGKWGTPSELIIEVQTPVWRTWWFWVLIIALLLSIPLLIFFNIITRQQAKILQQQKLNAERQRISTELHDDVGSALTKIALMGQSVQHDPEQLKNMIPRMTIAADQMVDQMNEIIWALNIRNDTLQNLLAYLHKYSFEFLDEKFILHISENDLTPEIELSGEVRRNIFLVVKEALHNILKHSAAQHVGLKFEISHSLKITIEDDGKGISEEKTNSFGNGMQNMKMRMKLIGGSLNIISSMSTNHGTKVEIEYPLK